MVLAICGWLACGLISSVSARSTFLLHNCPPTGDSPVSGRTIDTFAELVSAPLLHWEPYSLSRVLDAPRPQARQLEKKILDPALYI